MIHLAGPRVKGVALRALCGEALPPEAEPGAYSGGGEPCPRCAIEFMRYDYERSVRAALGKRGGRQPPAQGGPAIARVIKRH